MKSYGQLWDAIVSEENLREAWHRVRLGRGRSRRILAYERRIDRNLMRLRASLLDGTYRPGHYRQFCVMDPKPRTISCAPVQDRVVHHALCGVIAPLIEKRFVNRSYACREGYGTHLACVDARRELRRHAYFVKLDVRHYFQSIWHARLLDVLLPMFREEKVRDLLRKIVCHPVPGHAEGRGVPIGNLTSQWFANAYLDALDHYVMEDLGAGKAYFRYMDDILVFCETKAEAERYHAKISNWLDAERGLELKEKATRIAPVEDGVPFLGLRMWRQHWRLKRSRYLHARRSAAGRARLLARGGISEKQYADGLVSMTGVHAWFGFADVLRGLEAPREKAQLPFAHRGNKCGGFLPSAAGAGTTMPRTSALRAAMVTTGSRTRTTTSASAFPAPLRGGSHLGQRPVLRACCAGPNTSRSLAPVACRPRGRELAERGRCVRQAMAFGRELGVGVKR